MDYKEYDITSLRVTILGAGFIGLNLAKEFLVSGYHVDILDRGEMPLGLSSENLTWLQGCVSNTSNTASVIQNADVVFYLVSSTVPGDDVNVSKELFCNVSQLLQVLELCDSHKVGKFIFVSSSAVYGTQQVLPTSEQALPMPISAHGIQKLTMEYYISLFAYQSNTSCKILRLSNPYGPGQNIYGRQGFMSIVIGNITDKKAVSIRGTGEDIRDYIYISDVVTACQLAVTTASKEIIFNIGSGLGTSLLQVMSQFKDILQIPIAVSHQECRKSDIPVSILEIGKAKAILGFEPKITLCEGVKMFLNHHGVN